MIDFRRICATNKVFPNSCFNGFRKLAQNKLAKNKPLVLTDSTALLTQR